jgi:N-acetyl-anhydromuramyl-L-alanine amidase AmpD
MLVLHATVGSYNSALNWLTNPASKASTHYLIRKDGYIAQLVADNLAAWHAGASAWAGLNAEAIRERSIGIELENKNNGLDPYPPAQMAALLELSRALVSQYKIVPDMVTRHLDVAIPKGRKSDPAGFPWLQFKAALYETTSTTMHAGPFGAIARQDYMAAAPAAAYFAPGTAIALDEFRKNSYRHAASGIGFIAEGDLV